MTSIPKEHPRPIRKPLFSYPALPEIKFCFAVVVGCLAYAWYCVYNASTKFEFKIGHIASIHELPFFGQRFRDDSNWEWYRWRPHALQGLPLLALHSVLFNLGEKVLPKVIWTYGMILYSMAVSAYMYTPQLLAISLVQAILLFTTTYFIRSWRAVWLASLPVLIYVMNFTTALSDDPFLVLLFVSYTLLSYISFCLEWSRNALPHFTTETPLQLFTRMLFYAFYQPYQISVIVLYPAFEKQLAERAHKPRNWPSTLFFIARIAFWWCLAEAILYFFYFEVMLNDYYFAYQLPKNEFVTLGMALGAFFHLKYVVIFGYQAVFARLDNMDPPEGPLCISRVALYSKIWRGFDRGLYAYFKEYIFIPICEPTFSVSRKIFGVLASYTFVLIWHGFQHHNLVWIGLNILELFLEYGAKGIYSIKAVQNWREKNISDENFRRILGVLQIVCFAFGLYSNFYFLGGSQVGQMFVQRIFWEETYTLRWPFFLLITCGYFYTQVAMEVDRLAAIKKDGCPFGKAKDAKKGKKTD
uniref:MBOAT family protein n=1 Tax=Panagrellus redivivus TaxID=6233 RepID=A0A7E4W0H9_PANRE